jgi:hypothetical protein
MLTEAELRQIAERLAQGAGRFSPGSDAFHAMSRVVEAVKAAQVDVQRHDLTRGLSPR